MVNPTRVLAGVLVAGLGVWLAPADVAADHAWGYHWARTANPVALLVGDNVSPTWTGHLSDAIADWDGGGGGFDDVLDLTLVAGNTNPKNCRPVAGRIETCSSRYGNTGWLGVAQIWIDRAGHISQATTKINDYYFEWPEYDSPAVRQFVVCQEVGHAFGLNHQDEVFDNFNLGSCMDYTDHPAGSGGEPANVAPNAHDFEELESIYSHLDEPVTSGGRPGRGNGAGFPGMLPQLPEQALGVSPSEWGFMIRGNRATALFELDLGDGRRVFTFVIWS